MVRHYPGEKKTGEIKEGKRQQLPPKGGSWCDVPGLQDAKLSPLHVELQLSAHTLPWVLGIVWKGPFTHHTTNGSQQHTCAHLSTNLFESNSKYSIFKDLNKFLRVISIEV